MSCASPWDSKEYSIIHTFKTAEWISFNNTSDLLHRCAIMAIFIGGVITITLSVVYDNTYARFIGDMCCRFNLMTISLHTLLVCRSQIDRIYLIHLLGTSLCALVFSIGNFVEESRLWCLNGAGMLIFSMAFLIWSIPTRILYFKVFRFACVTLGTQSDKLLNMLIKYWILMVTSGVILSCILCPIYLMTKYETGPFDAHASLFWAMTTIFEIFMYSRINPLKWTLLGHRKLGLKLGEKLYIVMTSLMVLNALVQFSLDFALGGYVPVLSRVVGYVVVEIALTCRFVILWYYCVEELTFHENHVREKIKALDLTKPELRAEDRVDFSMLTEDEIQRLEV